MQSPAGYTSIYENWNVDLDEYGIADGLWDFGNASQYPTLGMALSRWYCAGKPSSFPSLADGREGKDEEFASDSAGDR